MRMNSCIQLRVNWIPGSKQLPEESLFLDGDRNERQPDRRVDYFFKYGKDGHQRIKKLNLPFILPDRTPYLGIKKPAPKTQKVRVKNGLKF